MRWIKQIATYFALVAALAPAAHAQSKNVVIAYQDMVVPWRYAQDMKELEKQTGYTVSFRQFGGGGDVIRAMASGQIAIGEAGTSPIASALSQGLDVELFGSWTTSTQPRRWWRAMAARSPASPT